MAGGRRGARRPFRNAQQRLLAFCEDPAMQETVAEALHRDRTDLAVRLLLLESIAVVSLEHLPASWLTELGHSLEHADERVVHQAVATLRMRRTAGLDDALVRVNKNPRRSPEVRVAALAAAAPRLDRLDQGEFDFLLSQLDSTRPPLLRRTAADALGNARLNDAQLTTLAEAAASAGALELPLLVSAFERSANPVVGNKLLVALSKTAGLSSLSPDTLRRTLQAYSAAGSARGRAVVPTTASGRPKAAGPSGGVRVGLARRQRSSRSQ